MQLPANGTCKTISKNLGTCKTWVQGHLGRAKEAQNATVMMLLSDCWKVKEKKPGISNANKTEKGGKNAIKQNETLPIA
jgi:hypothetical protein